MTAIIEITADNAERLGVEQGEAGRVALVDSDTTAVLSGMAAALDEITRRRLGDTTWTVGECLPLGEGRRWLVVDDDDR